MAPKGTPTLQQPVPTPRSASKVQHWCRCGVPNIYFLCHPCFRSNYRTSTLNEWFVCDQILIYAFFKNKMLPSASPLSLFVWCLLGIWGTWEWKITSTLRLCLKSHAYQALPLDIVCFYSHSHALLLFTRSNIRPWTQAKAYADGDDGWAEYLGVDRDSLKVRIAQNYRNLNRLLHFLVLNWGLRSWVRVCLQMHRCMTHFLAIYTHIEDI